MRLAILLPVGDLTLIQALVLRSIPANEHKRHMKIFIVNNKFLVCIFRCFNYLFKQLMFVRKPHDYRHVSKAIFCKTF